MPGQHPGTFARNARCREKLEIAWSELEILLAIDAHLRAFGEPVLRKDLEEFCMSNPEIETTEIEYPIYKLKRERLIERANDGNPARYRPTARGSAKIAAWRRFERKGSAAE